MASTSLQNINWLSKKVWTVYIKEKNVYCPSLIPSPYNVFLYFLEGQVHKDSKLGIMTILSKNRLVKVIFTNVHKVSDACENSFGRYIMIAQCMRNVFAFYHIYSSFSGRKVFLKKLKLIYPQQLPALQQLFSPTLSILFKKVVSHTPI